MEQRDEHGHTYREFVRPTLTEADYQRLAPRWITEHGGKKMSDRDCTLACVKEHNAKYVFVSDGKVYNVGNQDFAALQEHAGHTVRLTGEMSGDTITVSKIAMPGKK